MKRRLWGGAAFLAIVLVATCPCGGGDLSNLTGALEALAGSIKSFEADVTVTVRPINDRAAYKEARANWAVWLKSHGHADGAARVLADLNQEYLTWPSEFHYSVDAGKAIRIDRPSSEGSVTSVYSGGRFATLLTRPGAAGQMNVHEYFPSVLPTNVEVARGAGVEASRGLVRSGVPASDVFAHTVLWRDLAKVLDTCQRIDAIDSLPRDLGPMYRAATKPYKTDRWPNPSPRCVYEIALDARANLAPVYLKVSDLVPHQNGIHQYLIDRTIRWSSPEFFPGGAVVFRHCRVGIFETVPSPDMSFNKDEDFPRESYEVLSHEITFSNMKVNAPIDDGVFNLVAPEGSNVIDYPAGERYIAGPAGERLEPKALSDYGKCETKEDPAMPPSARWNLLIGVCVALFVPLLAVWGYRRFHSVVK
jgi:hypothetical protein